MPTMGSDLRISCSSEIKANLPDSTKVKVNQTRIKERTSFQFNWMRLDMTVTSATNNKTGGKPELNYEVELEISDI